jgi:hypothetical protein
MECCYNPLAADGDRILFGCGGDRKWQSYGETM